MTRTISNELLAQKLAEALRSPVPERTRRDIRLPNVPNKAHAVIGVRRGGKTSFLQRCMADRIDDGEPPDAHLLLSLEDERLVGMSAEDLGWLLEEYRRLTPTIPRGQRTIYLDEIQSIDGWATLVRRLLDEGEFRVFVSGSSAKLLSREIHTALRGRSMETLVHPFSFREALRHRGEEPTHPWHALAPQERINLDAALRRYLDFGGFPEAQTVEGIDRIPLLKGYVDVMLLRDVIERHGVSNTDALRRLQRALLTNPAGRFAMSKFYNDLKSQGGQASKDALYAYLAHLEDAFLVRLVSMHTTSERQRNVNPRKVYPIDTGFIRVYQRGGQQNRGRSLETAILLELERRGATAGWVRVGNDLEVDFCVERFDRAPLLIQVSLDTALPETFEREITALAAAASEYPDAQPVLITLDPAPPSRILPAGITWRPATDWLLDPTA